MPIDETYPPLIPKVFLFVSRGTDRVFIGRPIGNLRFFTAAFRDIGILGGGLK